MNQGLFIPACALLLKMKNFFGKAPFRLALSGLFACRLQLNTGIASSQGKTSPVARLPLSFVDRRYP
jgi:hypothetical protein